MTTRTSGFSGSDIARWQEVDAVDLARRPVRIRNGEIRQGREIRALAHNHEMSGLTQIALQNYSRALGHFSAAATCWADLLARKARGEEIAPDLVSMAQNAFDLAVASGDDDVIDRVAKAYAAACPNPRESVSTYFGWSLRALATGDVETASQLLSTPPKMDADSKASLELLVAIANYDRSAFLEGIKQAVAFWRERIRSERLQKYPDAVCDHTTFGTIRLAERVWGKKLELEVANIPKELYSATPDAIDVGV